MAERYSRQILFAGVGAAGQTLLDRAHVAIVGVGATGAASAALLARAGVGRLTLIDRDVVEASNLQRQILFDEADAVAALPKAEAARSKIALFNSAVKVEAVVADLVPSNIHSLLVAADLILDCTDNFETRFLLNDYCVGGSKPWIYAAAIGGYAASMNILPRGASREGTGEGAEYAPTACLACMFPAPPTGVIETCDTAGILSTAVMMASSVQCTEALKLLTGQPQQMRRTLLSHDLWANTRAEVSAGEPDPACTVCGRRVFAHLAGSARPHITLCGRNSVQIHEMRRPLDFAALVARLGKQPEVEDVRCTSMLLRFRRGAQTLTLFPDGRALIQGTTDVALARSLYARFIGS